MLDRSQTDPRRRTAAGVFAGQVLALRLNVDFSAAGITPPGLGSLRMTWGDLEGWTVQEVLWLAEMALGGDMGVLPDGVSLPGLNDAVTLINESFSGAGHNGLLE